MKSIPGRRIGEQNEAYRKGLVLGLTMAETGILIIFVLLLLLAFGQRRQADLFRKYVGKEAVDVADLQRLRVAESMADSIAGLLGVQGAHEEDFTKLVRVLQDMQQSPGATTALAEARNTLSDIREARNRIEQVAAAAQEGGSGAIAKHVEEQSYRLANQEGQLSGLEKKLLAAGQGKGERPCWAEPDGTIDYLYDVVLTSSGIRMREHLYPHRARERQLLPMPATDPQEVLLESVFLARTAPLFRHSKQNNCRFFVVIYDATASHEKPLYKSLLRTVEGHFYKRLDNGSAPF
jgi:hypothetical protein